VATRRNFTSQEYKDQAISLVLDSGRSTVEVAKSIGVHEMTLGKWVKKARESGRVPDKDLSKPERAELERLRKEIVTLKMEPDFAKKWPPGSRKNSREIRGDRGLGHRQAAPGHVHVRPIGVDRQGYYRWLASGPSERDRSDAELTATIQEIHTALHGHLAAGHEADAVTPVSVSARGRRPRCRPFRRWSPAPPSRAGAR
jgi:transposase